MAESDSVTDPLCKICGDPSPDGLLNSQCVYCQEHDDRERDAIQGERIGKLERIQERLIRAVEALEKKAYPVMVGPVPSDSDLYDLMIQAIKTVPPLTEGNWIVAGHAGATLSEQIELHKARKCGCKVFTPAEAVAWNRARAECVECNTHGNCPKHPTPARTYYR